MRARLGPVGIGLLAGGLQLALPAGASASACTTSDGVSVIVDFGATVQTGCALADPTSAWAALQSAGFAVEGTQRFPGSFVCRINGFPAPADDACVQTPPSTAYWAFWTAPAGGSWRYSTTGASSVDPAPGTAIGFAFGGGTKPSQSPPAPPPSPTPSSTTRPATDSSSSSASSASSSTRQATAPSNTSGATTPGNTGSLSGSSSGTTPSVSMTSGQSGTPTTTSTSPAATAPGSPGSDATASGPTASGSGGLPEGSVGAVAAGTGLALVLGGAAYGISRRRRGEQ